MSIDKVINEERLDFNWTQNEKIQRLEIFDTIFKFIPNNLFDKLRNLNTLEVINSRFTDLRASILKSENLLNLRFEGNSINFIPPNAFIFLPRLQVLILIHNNIESIDQNAFNRLNNLEKLNLEGNKILKLKVETFRNLISLTHLSLAKNSLRQLDGKLLEAQKQIQVVKFNENPIEIIGNELLNYSNKLTNANFTGTCLGNVNFRGIDEIKLRIAKYC
jgi:Leucine-rich repeat (LRR) protein